MMTDQQIIRRRRQHQHDHRAVVVVRRTSSPQEGCSCLLLLLVLLGPVLTCQGTTTSSIGPSSSFHSRIPSVLLEKKIDTASNSGFTSNNIIRRGRGRKQQPRDGWWMMSMISRGGSTTTTVNNGHDAAVEGSNDADIIDGDSGDDDIRNHPDYKELAKYRMEQQALMELRSAFLADALADRGLPFPTVRTASTPEGKEPPKHVDWDCAISTREKPKECIISHLAEEGTKVISPIDTDQDWVTLTELVKLRRNDPSKVDGMWHNKYSVLEGWFGPQSDYSLLQHVGAKGLILDFLLTGNRFKAVMLFAMAMSVVALMPVLEYIVCRIVVSGLFWSNWIRWRLLYRAALPMQIFVGQMTFGILSKYFSKLAAYVKEKMVLMECEVMEERIPLTVGVPDLELDGRVDSETITVESNENESESSEEDEGDDEDESDDDDEEEEDGAE